METEETRLNTFEYLLDFLEGKLTDKEESAIRSRMEMDAEYRELIEELDQAQKKDPDYRNRIIEQHELLFKQLDQLTNHEIAPPQTQIRRLAPWVGAAAAALILVFSYWIWFSKGQQMYCNVQDLICILEQETPYQGRIFLMGDSSRNQSLEAAMTAYNAGSYQVAIPIFESLLATQDINPAIRQELTLSLAVAYLFEEQSAQALPLLGEVADYEETRFQAEAEWYSALAYIQLGQQEEAKTLLEALAAYQNPHSESARVYLDQLD